jgi:hypothetical protein
MRLASRSAIAACCLLFMYSVSANAQSADSVATAISRAPAATAEPVPTIVITARRVKRPRIRKPLVLSVPRFSFENIALSSTVSGSFNSSVNYLQREMHTAHHVVEDISLFRFRLTPEWSLQWDFNRQSQPADRVLALNVGLYHDF